MIETPLFEGSTIRLTGINLDQDPAVEAGYTLNLDYARLFRYRPVRPLAESELKKHYEEMARRMSETGSEFYFAIRPKNGEQYLGFVRIPWVAWSHGCGALQLAIGAPEWQGRCEREVLDLILAYAFDELNLFRISVDVLEFERDSVELFEQAGFTLEVRQRENIFRSGRYWDLFIYAILQSEWRQR